MVETSQCENFIIFLQITGILREINFRDFRSTKSVILTHLEALNFVFYELLHFFQAEINQINKIQKAKVAKTVVLELRDSTKLTSRKIRLTENS